jgi:ankyrin repeat protein
MLVLHLSEQIEMVNSGLERAFEQRSSHHQDLVMRYAKEDECRCHQAFKTSTYEEFKDHNPNRVEGTCEWVLNSHEYLQWWKATNNDILWISADPGCGKSVLAKSLIDEVFALSSSNVSTVYFFFKDNDEQNNLASALCAVLHQLFSLQPHLLAHALPSWKKNKEKIQYEVDEMWRIFMEATSDPACGNTICLFDGLDECREQDQIRLVKKLHLFQNQRSMGKENWLKFLVTSRPYDDIQDRFEPITRSFPQIHLRGEEENDRIREEINLVVRVKVKELSVSLNLSSAKQKELEKELTRIKHRTYLWLHLAVDDIRKTLKDSFRPNEESIPPLPKSVNEAYAKILARIQVDQKPKAKLILRVVVGARRPLHIHELAMALGIATSPNAKTASRAGLQRNGLDKRIRRLCGLFVFIRESKVYLIHQSARDFLTAKFSHTSRSEWYLEPQTTELQMAEICVRYLVMDDVENDARDYVLSLLDYAAENWADHFRAVISPNQKLVQWVNELYHALSNRLSVWFPRFWKKAKPFWGYHPTNLIQLSAFNGHRNILSQLLSSGRWSNDKVDSHGMTALKWACESGHVDVVKILLCKGADFNGGSQMYEEALLVASEYGHSEIVQMLLEYGVDVDAGDEEFGTALQIAAAEGHSEVVHVLLRQGANVNACSEQYDSALHAASREGHSEIVAELLVYGADVNAQNTNHETALYAPCREGYIDIVELLLKDRALDACQAGALHEASAVGFLDIVQCLVHKGARVNAQVDYDGNALQQASLGGHINIVQYLLNLKADVNAQGGFYGNALQAASARGHLEIVRLIIKHGVNVRTQGGRYGNALQAASAAGVLEGPHMVLQEGPQIYANNTDHVNSIFAALVQRHTIIVEILLNYGADVHSQGGCLGNALQAASLGGGIAIVNMLLEKGADVNSQGGQYANALYAASAKGHLEIVQRLLDEGADVNAQGGHYGNALQVASMGINEKIQRILLDDESDDRVYDYPCGSQYDIVQILLERGADVNAQGGFYGNALQAASAGGHLDVVQALFKAGADVNAQGGKYSTALCAATEKGYQEIVQMLLSNGAQVGSRESTIQN